MLCDAAVFGAWRGTTLDQGAAEALSPRAHSAVTVLVLEWCVTEGLVDVPLRARFYK